MKILQILESEKKLAVISHEDRSAFMKIYHSNILKI